MDDSKRMKLIEIYERCSDDEIREMIQEGKDSFEEGAYDLIRIEARKRRINIKPDNKPGKKMKFDDVFNELVMDFLHTKLDFYNKVSDKEISEYLKTKLFDDLLKRVQVKAS